MIFIVIKERDRIIEKIREEEEKINKNKIELNMLIKYKNKNNFIFEPNLNQFGINKIYIQNFLIELWKYPEGIFHILNNTETQIIQTNLAPFICHNFFCNHLSGNFTENNLLFIISMMLKDEIDKLENINQLDTFLERTKCGYLLEELKQVPDIQIYFNKVIINAVEKLENSYSSKEINFNCFEILNEYTIINEGKEQFEKEDIKDLSKNENPIDSDINKSKEDYNSKNYEINNNFNDKKLFNDLTIKEIEDFKQKAKKEDKNNLYEYYNKILEKCENGNNQKLYSDKDIIKKLNDKHLLSFYHHNFNQVISFIEQLLEDLKKFILLMPYSIRSICKIIYLLVKNKFKDISKLEQNFVVSKFIINKLLIPFLLSPNFSALISDFYISENTIKNLEIICFIIKTLFSGKLFFNNSKEENYTPFNWFFMEKMENIILFFDKAISVSLPSFIEKFINDKFPMDYSYDYFKENKEKMCADISICFNLSNLIYLIKGYSKLNNILLNNNPERKKLKISYNKLKDSLENIKNESFLNKYKEKDKNIDIETDIYFLSHYLEIKETYKNLFIINDKNTDFYIDIKQKDKLYRLNENDKNIIKAKNFLCKALGKIRLLTKLDFNIEKSSNILELLTHIKSYISLQNSINNEGDVLSVWYFNALLYFLNIIPEDYKKNDFKILFNELSINIHDSIVNLDFGKLILLESNLEILDKINNYYNNGKESFKNIFINKKIKKIAEEAFIPVEMIFNYDYESKGFDLSKSNVKEKAFGEKMFYEIPKKKIKVIKTIESFIRYFPNIAEYQISQKIEPFDIIKELSINKKIMNYLHIIFDYLRKEKLADYYELDLFKEKMANYIFSKIYEKLYPPKPCDRDKKIFDKTMSFSWVEVKNIITNDYICDNILLDILDKFNQII